MNRKRDKKQHIVAHLSVSVLLLLLALAACTAEPLADGGNPASSEEQTVEITLLPPGAFDNYSATRAMTPAQEGAIAKAVVLQFETNKLVKWVDATATTGSDGKPKLTATIKSSLKATQRYDLVVLANASVAASSFAPYTGQSKEQIGAALVAESYTDKWASAPIPCGGSCRGLQSLRSPTSSPCHCCDRLPASTSVWVPTTLLATAGWGWQRR